MRESVTEWRARKLAEKNAKHQKRVMRDAAFWGCMIGVTMFCVGVLNLDHNIKMGIILLVTGFSTACFCALVRAWWT